jgi:hypothetical protein
MLRFKLYKKLKGSISLYVLIWGLLITTMLLLAFSLECERRKSLVYLEKQIERTPVSNMYREYLFSSFNEKFRVWLNNNYSITQEKVDEFIINSYNSSDMSLEHALTDVEGKCKLYVKSDKNVIFIYRNEENNKVFECYKINAVDGKIKFYIIQSGFLPQENDL